MKNKINIPLIEDIKKSVNIDKDQKNIGHFIIGI